MRVSKTRRQILLGIVGAAATPRSVLGGNPSRVASLDWALTETMLMLGHPPIAIVGAADWSRWVVEPALPPGVVDLGLSQDPNFELLAALRPTLILSSPFLQNLEPTMRRIAPVVRLSIFEKTNEPLGQPRYLATRLGELLNRRQEASRFLERADEELERHRARIAALRPPPVLIGNFIDARHLRIYGGSGLFQNVLDRIGVVNAWPGATNYWGYATVGIEKLAMDRDLRLVIFEPIPPDAHPTLALSPLWSRLPFVQAGHLSVLPPVLMFGALPAALRFARLLVDCLEKAA